MVLGSRIASGVDRFFAAVALGRTRRSRRRSRAESLGHDERMVGLETLIARHNEAPFNTAPDVFFGQAGEAGDVLRTPVRRYGNEFGKKSGEVVDVRWRSGYVPAAPEEETRERYLKRASNDWGHARLFLHRGAPRPAAILVHGYLGGPYAIEERAWPLAWMFDRLGLDLALAVLPFHGPRNGGRGRPLFPASDPRITIEGFRQAVWDLTSLRRFLAARGAPAVGLMGMSLGGYTTALTATADADFAFAVPMIPLASIADFARAAGRLVGTEDEQRLQHEALERAHAPVSPLARPSLLDPERVIVLAGLADRITPITHAERLASHFGAELETFYGGHLLQLGRREGFRKVAQRLRELGIARARSS